MSGLGGLVSTEGLVDDVPPVMDNSATPPSPEETDAMAREELLETQQRRRDAAARDFAAFLDAQTQKITKKGEDSTNIIDQGNRVTYAFPPDTVHIMFDHLEKMRRKGFTAHFSERQGTPGAPLSGLMIDYDVVVADAGARLQDRHLHRIACRIVRALRQDLVFPGGARAPSGAETTLHVFSLIKPAPVAIQTPSGTPSETSEAPIRTLYKYGFHVLVPGIRVSRGYKKYLLRSIAADSSIKTVLTDLKAVGDTTKCLDMNSASVPVLFAGSCKRGGVPYQIGPSFEITFEAAFDAGDGKQPPPVDETFYPIVKTLTTNSLEDYNLVAELSLCFEARYDSRRPLVPAWECSYRQELRSEIEAIGARNQKSDEEFLLAQHSLSTLAVHDAEARYLHQVLDLLDESYHTDRNKWRDVVFALANTSETYKPLAEWFSQKYYKWADKTSKRLESFDQMWEDAVSRREAVKNPLTKRSLIRWAQMSNPERFKRISEQNYFTILANYVYSYGGVLEHYMVAKVLYAMLGNKFIVDIDEGHRGRYTYCWYEFVVPGQTSRPGEVWKWRKEVEPDELHSYLSENIPKVLGRVARDVDDRLKEAADENQAKFYKKVAAMFVTSQRKIFNDTFKNGVIKQANYLFRRRGFVDTLDRVADLMGVGNGILRLGSSCTLIDHFHEHPVMKYSQVAYRPFNPSDPWTKLMLNAFADIIPEDDVRDWILFDAATALSGAIKEGIILLWFGGGANGKTFVMRMIAKTLGMYAKKLNIALLTSERESADKANSARMQLKQIRMGYFEETQKAEILNDQCLKEIVNPGEISGRELYGRQENFELTATLVVGHNFTFVIKTTDHGTWRRIRFYRSKVKFCANPDRDNPYEKKDDQRFLIEYVNDPDCQAAMLGILVHYYERLQREYGGLIKRVPCPTIDRETEIYRNSQDTINRFITEMIVHSPGNGHSYLLAVVANCYIEWYNANIDRRRHIASEIIQDLENSALQRYLKRGQNQTLLLVDCRILSKEISALAEGETFLSAGGNREMLHLSPPIKINSDRTREWWKSPSVGIGPTGIEPTGVGPSPPHGSRQDNVDFGEDRIPEPLNNNPPPKQEKDRITDEDVESILSGETCGFTLSDVYD